MPARIDEHLGVVVSQRDRARTPPAIAIVRNDREVAFSLEETGKLVALGTLEPGGGLDSGSDGGLTARPASHRRFSLEVP